MKVKRISEIRDITTPAIVTTNITYQVQVTCISEGKIYDLEVTPETLDTTMQCRCSVCGESITLPDITTYLSQSRNVHPSLFSHTLLSMRLLNVGKHHVVIKSKPTEEDFKEYLELSHNHPNKFTILHAYHDELLRAYAGDNEKQLLDFDMSFGGSLSDGTGCDDL